MQALVLANWNLMIDRYLLYLLGKQYPYYLQLKKWVNERA